MSQPTRLSFTREIINGLFPWIGRIGLSASKALQVRSPVGRIELEGGGPAVVRVGDFVIRLSFYPGVPNSVAPSVWFSASTAAPYTWAPLATCAVTGPLTTDGGTPINCAVGSTKVTCG
jgi:hypothetical protein